MQKRRRKTKPTVFCLETYGSNLIQTGTNQVNSSTVFQTSDFQTASKSTPAAHKCCLPSAPAPQAFASAPAANCSVSKKCPMSQSRSKTFFQGSHAHLALLLFFFLFQKYLGLTSQFFFNICASLFTRLS